MPTGKRPKELSLRLWVEGKSVADTPADMRQIGAANGFGVRLSKMRQQWETKTIDEDIHQAENTGLPAGLIVHEAHADEGAKEIFGTNIGAYLPSGNG